MQAPVDLTDIESIVESLYNVNDPKYIYSTQSKLQAIQRSDQGWDMANQLLGSDKPTCQFFGALTFRVRINSMTDDEIKDKDLSGMLAQLLQWLIYHRQQNSAKFVLQKIVSTLSFFFAKFTDTWPRCVESFILSIQSGRPIIQLPETSGSSSVHETLAADCLAQGLWFCETLMQDLSGNQGSLTDAEQLKINAILQQNVASATALIKQALDLGSRDMNESNRVLIHRGIDTLGAWIVYFRQSQIDTDVLQPFSEYLLFYLRYAPDEEIYSAVSTIIADTYTNRPSFWPQWFKEQFVTVLLEQGATINPEEAVDERIDAYTNMILGFCELYTKQCLEREGQFSALLDVLMKLTQLPGVPLTDENPIALRMLEFWTNYAEEYFVVDLVNQGQDQVILLMVNAFWIKARLPDLEMASDWNSDAWDEFNSFRRDFCDFLELVYPIVGVNKQGDENIFNKLVGNTCELLKTAGPIAWTETECNLFCLNGMSDALSDTQKADFGYIFESPLFARLPECDRPRVHTTVVSMIGLYDSFFETEQGKPLITSALEYLFKSLSNNTIASTASKSIYKLCDLSRKNLAELLPDFVNIYQSLLTSIMDDATAQERTACAIACVIQALGDINLQAEYVDRLVSLLVSQIETEFAAQAKIERICSLVKCLSAIGKGLQIPCEEDYSIETPHSLAVREFWDRDERGIRQKLLQVVRVLTIDQQPYNQQVDICEACCDIFKQGFREDLANPFVFPGDYVVEFLQLKYSKGPPTTLGVLTDTACCFLTSNTMPTDPQANSQVARTIIDIFFPPSDDAKNDEDADVQANKLKLLTQLIKHHDKTLLEHPRVTQNLEFVVMMLASDTKFVLQEACKFWTQVVVNPEGVRVYDQFAPQICRVLADKVSGSASRSDLGAYSSLVKKIVFKSPRVTKQCLSQFITVEPVSQSLARKDYKFRDQFIQKLFLTRGGQQAGDVVRDFWTGCRGLAYT